MTEKQTKIGALQQIKVYISIIMDYKRLSATRIRYLNHRVSGTIEMVPKTSDGPNFEIILIVAKNPRTGFHSPICEHTKHNSFQKVSISNSILWRSSVFKIHWSRKPQSTHTILRLWNSFLYCCWTSIERDASFITEYERKIGPYTYRKYALDGMYTRRG